MIRVYLPHCSKNSSKICDRIKQNKKYLIETLITDFKNYLQTIPMTQVDFHSSVLQIII